MNDSRRKRVEQLFQATIDLAVDRQAEFLNDHCGCDAELRTDVEQLLRAHDSDMGDFLRPLTVHQLPTTPPGDSSTPVPSDRLTATIGHYRLHLTAQSPDSCEFNYRVRPTFTWTKWRSISLVDVETLPYANRPRRAVQANGRLGARWHNRQAD